MKLISLFLFSGQSRLELLLLAFKHASGERHQALRTSNQVDQVVEESLLPEEVVVRSRRLHSFQDEQDNEGVR